MHRKTSNPRDWTHLINGVGLLAVDATAGVLFGAFGRISGWW